MQILGRGLGALAVWLLIACASALAQQTSNQQEWTWTEQVGWRSRSLPLGPLFQLNLDGRNVLTASQSSRGSAGSDDSGGAPDAEGVSRSRHTSGPILVERQMKHDPRRHAIQILDVFTNIATEERSIQVEYSTNLNTRGSFRIAGVMTQQGEVTQHGNELPEDSVAAIILNEQMAVSTLPLLVWGPANAPWPATFYETGSQFRLGYQGSIPPGGKVALLHWVAAAGRSKDLKLERTFSLFWKDGRLVNPMLPPDIAPLVMNFPADAVKSPDASLAQTEPTGRLVDLEALCEKLEITRGDADILWMGTDEQFSGRVVGEAVLLQLGGVELKVPLDSVAAIRGGGGRGREHRIYMRDGSVHGGRAKLPGVKLTSDLGEMILDQDGLELLVLHRSKQDGKAPASARGFVQLRDGSVFWLDGEGIPAMDLVTVFGALKVTPAELWSLQRRTEPPFNLVATLSDGSRIHGVARQDQLPFPLMGSSPRTFRVADISRLGAAGQLVGEMTPPPEQDVLPEPAKSESPANYCWLRDGSLLVGKLGGGSLKVRVGANEVEVKATELSQLSISTESIDEATVTLQSGAVVKGELLTEFLPWKRGAQELRLPVVWITELRQKRDEAAPASGTPPLVQNEKEEGTPSITGDPLAPPKGFSRDELVEISPDYPKPMLIGVPAPTVHIPNLEKYDPVLAAARTKFLVPKGASNVALGKKVTGSDPQPLIGSYILLTNGDAEGGDGSYVELAPGPQWVQVDLGARHRIWKVLLWHFHKRAGVYYDVVVQASDDPEFKKGVTTIFNNDHEDKLNMGKGKDVCYVETHRGRLINGRGSSGRYVRFYSNGNSADEMNHYIEIMVFGSKDSGDSAASAISPGR